MKKKIISAILCVALTAVSVVSSSAVDTDNSLTSGANGSSYQILGEKSLPNNFATFFTSGSGFDPTSKIVLADPDTHKNVFSYTFSSTSPNGVSKSLPNGNGYVLRTYLRNSGSGAGKVLNFSDGGTYEKIKIKLSDFSELFNSDGTVTKELENDTHNYNFTKEADGAHSSLLIFYSGNAITAAAPDENGMVEIYLSTKLGQDTFFTVDYCFMGSQGLSIGGIPDNDFFGFTIGDVNKDGKVNLNDGILAQKAASGINTLYPLARRNADTNRNGKVDLIDAISIQKFRLNK